MALFAVLPLWVAPLAVEVKLRSRSERSWSVTTLAGIDTSVRDTEQGEEGRRRARRPAGTASSSQEP